MKEISFIHCADLHLDSPMIGLRDLPSSIKKRLQESTFAAFTNLVDKAIALQVDFIIIAGDIYDGEDRSIRAQIRFKKELERLQKQDIAVFIVHGNHDHLSGSWVQIKWPDNVHIFPSDVTQIVYTTGTTTVSLYGFSYETRHIYDRKIDLYKKENNADFHIGILHGSIEGSTDHSPYAPFHLHDLTSKLMDYWALGHIHKREVLQQYPPIVYPGNIQGRHKKETDEKGAYFVQLSEEGTELEFFATADIIWRKIEIDAAKVQSFDELLILCKQKMDAERTASHSSILFFEIINLSIHETVLPAELLEILQEEEIEDQQFVWVSSLKIIENTTWIKDNLINESDFYKELFTVAEDKMAVEKGVASLYHNPAAHRFLEELTEEDKKNLAEEAEHLLIQLLYSE
ncbi:metallophosphoesterase family protein [Niallia sp. 01092]|uniref:metallophosphoesterase family protein n=1 Tax=unclassified Niallia TaxID=2837522 RepID=UPI003FCF7C5C